MASAMARAQSRRKSAMLQNAIEMIASTREGIRIALFYQTTFGEERASKLLVQFLDLFIDQFVKKVAELRPDLDKEANAESITMEFLQHFEVFEEVVEKVKEQESDAVIAL
jgi:hypothetical protein